MRQAQRQRGLGCCEHGCRCGHALAGSGTSVARRGVPMGAADWPLRVAAISSSLGYWPSSTKSNTRRAIGAAAAAPKPAFSTITATAMDGSGSGAAAMYSEWSRLCSSSFDASYF